jgi:hypothetical protein
MDFSLSLHISIEEYSDLELKLEESMLFARYSFEVEINEMKAWQRCVYRF